MFCEDVNPAEKSKFLGAANIVGTDMKKNFLLVIFTKLDNTFWAVFKYRPSERAFIWSNPKLRCEYSINYEIC